MARGAAEVGDRHLDGRQARRDLADADPQGMIAARHDRNVRAVDPLRPEEAERLKPRPEMRLADISALRIVQHQCRRDQLPRHRYRVQSPEVHGSEIVQRKGFSPADRRSREWRGRCEEQETQAQTDARLHVCGPWMRKRCTAVAKTSGSSQCG